MTREEKASFSLVVPEKLATDVQLQLGRERSDMTESRLNFPGSVTKGFPLTFSQPSSTVPETLLLNGG